MVNAAPFRLPPVDEIVLSASPGETRAATLRNGEVWGLAWDWPDAPNPVGAVHGVRITRLAPQARGAFVVVDGQGQEGFLDLAGLKTPPHEGQRLLAQVTRAPEPGKRLTLSPAVRLAGRYLVYTPLRAGISASRQISDKAVAQHLQGLVKSAARPGEGMIVRAAATAVAATPDVLLAELERHRAAWDAASASNALGIVIAAPNLAEALLIERASTGSLTVTVDAPALLAACNAAASTWTPTEPITVSLDRTNPFASTGGDEAFTIAASTQVPLATGGSLWLEPTRACWTADVDSGNAQGPAEAVRFETNQAAAIELARQIRLRQAAGAFIADFLRLSDAKAQAAIIQTLRNAFADDPAPLRFNPGFDPLGFYAFSRGRIAPPFAARTAYGGHRQALLAGLRALVRTTLANPTSRLALYLPAATIEAAAHLPIALQHTQDQLGQTPVIQADASLRAGSYAVRPFRPKPPAHETSA